MPSQLTDLEQLLLLAVLRLGKEAYGARIQDEIQQHAGRRVALGSVHITLSRLGERGLAGSEKSAPLATRGGKARRIYSVTEAGRSALEESRAVMDEMWSGVPARGESR